MPDSAWDLVARAMAELRALSGAVGLLSWDQETYLPPRGGR
jgi:carboxypeptidase Taq